MRAEQMRIYQAVAELAREIDQILPTLPRRAKRKAIARLVDSKAVPAARMKRSDYLADCSIGMLTNMIKQQEARTDD